MLRVKRALRTTTSLLRRAWSVWDRGWSNGKQQASAVWTGMGHVGARSATRGAAGGRGRHGAGRGRAQLVRRARVDGPEHTPTAAMQATASGTAMAPPVCPPSVHMIDRRLTDHGEVA